MTSSLIYSFCCTLALSFFPFATVNAQNNALDFDGSDDYVIAPDMTELDGVSQFTIEMWVKFDGFTSFATLIEKRLDSNSDITIQASGLGVGGNDLFFGVMNGYPARGVLSNVITLNNWFHIAMVFDGNQPTSATRLKAYINGVQQILTYNDSIPAVSPANNSTVNLGREPNNLRYPFAGKLDEVRIWSKARCEAEIISNLNCSLSGNEANLVAYYDFDQGSAGANNSGLNILTDQSLNGYHGSLLGFALAGNNSNWVSSGATLGGVCNNSVICPATSVVPTLSQWGLIILGCILLCIGAIAIRSRAPKYMPK